MKHLLALALMFVGSSHAFAEVVGLTVWDPVKGGPRLLLPRIKNETPEETAERFKKALAASDRYGKVYAAEEMELPIHGFQPMRKEPDLTRPTTDVLIIGNRPGHISSEDSFVKSVIDKYKRARGRPFVLPVGLETILTSERDLDRLQEIIDNRFPLISFIGGSDVDSKLYGQEKTHSKNVDPEKDRVEHKLARRRIQSQQGVIGAICRGKQLCAVAMGFQLHQDLILDGVTDKEHSLKNSSTDASHQSKTHGLKLVDKKNWLYEATGKTSFQVNSRHHQAVNEKTGDTLRAIAYSPDGVVEAMEGRNIFLVQFHPEDMEGANGQKIFDYWVKAARERWRGCAPSYSKLKSNP